MSECIVTKGPDGKLQGFGRKGAQDYERWKRLVASLRAGDLLHFSYREPRSPQHHKLWFAKMGALLERQEQFDSLDKLRMWVTVGAGYAEFAPGPQGRMVALPQSIAWDKMDEAEFRALHEAADAFLRTPHAQSFLWGHLTQQQQSDMVETLLAEFDAESATR
jgi:hypothetical protein